MRNLKVRIGVLVFAATAAIAGSVTLATATSSSIRFCCTPQQSAACAAKGGTVSCRTGVCLCQF
jgi:hypothetical protein